MADLWRGPALGERRHKPTGACAASAPHSAAGIGASIGGRALARYARKPSVLDAADLPNLLDRTRRVDYDRPACLNAMTFIAIIVEESADDADMFHRALLPYLPLPDQTTASDPYLTFLPSVRLPSRVRYGWDTHANHQSYTESARANHSESHLSEKRRAEQDAPWSMSRSLRDCRTPERVGLYPHYCSAR